MQYLFVYLFIFIVVGIQSRDLGMLGNLSVVYILKPCLFLLLLFVFRSLSIRFKLADLKIVTFPLRPPEC